MKQHPIPQNVLDVEFKLFTKFTLKEFAYLLAGILSGSIFLLLNRQVGLPGLIAWPAFLILSSIGAFFALVPINDQNADEFIKNYFKAINKPTQRVWLNEQMKENRIKPVIDSDVNEKNKIIGSSSTKKSKTFEEKPGDDIFENKEENQDQIKKSSTQDVNRDIPENTTPRIITIGPQNLSQYQFTIQSTNQLPGNINIWLADQNNRGLSNIPVLLKDKDDRVIFANRTGPNGYFLTNQNFPQGVYYIEFNQDIYQIPKLKLVLQGGETKNPIKITAKLK